MTGTEVLKLLDAGYTKEEIEKFNAEDPAGKQEEKKPDPKQEEKKPDPDPKPEEKKEGPAQPDDVIKQLMEQNKQMLETIKAMQDKNAADARQPEPEGKKTADSVIKDFISKL